MKMIRSMALCALVVSGCLSIVPWAAAGEGANSAIVAAPRDEWMQAHRSYVERAAQGGADIVFLGDSITEGWKSAGKEFWAGRYTPRKAVNFGIGGDRTENVLWRIQNGELDGIKPKVVVLLIGTNNFKTGNTPPQIAEGISAVVSEVRKRLPETKVLVVGVFPRGDKPDSAYRQSIKDLNASVAKLDDGKSVYFLDLGSRFLKPDGSITADIMPDFLHLSPAGYKIYSDALDEKLSPLLGPS